jgi:hypothetical protein
LQGLPDQQLETDQTGRNAMDAEWLRPNHFLRKSRNDKLLLQHQLVATGCNHPLVISEVSGLLHVLSILSINSPLAATQKGSQQAGSTTDKV